MSEALLPSGVRLRPLRGEDVPEVVDIWEACGLTRPWNDPRADIARCRESAASELFVAELHPPPEGESGRLCGTVMAGWDGHRAWIYYLGVRPRWQGRGVGRALVRHAQAWLRRLGAPKVMLMIREGNEGVRRFYENLGYREERRVVMSLWLQEQEGNHAR